MKILAVSDHESKYLWDHFDPEKLKDVDLILSCGDLDSRYLSFLATFSHAKVLYVRGNHDDHYALRPPEGCICIEDDLYVVDGVRILGLGGSMRYNPKGENQYTQRQMRRRARRLWWKIFCHRGFDILLTHSPAEGLNDGEDRAHWGFAAFNDLLDKYHPKYFVHGHVHLNYGHKVPRLTQYGQTQIINAYERTTFEYPGSQQKAEDAACGDT